MRRKDRELTERKDIEMILRSAKVLRLGLAAERCPYVVPLHYGYTYAEDGTITLYMHSAPEGRKLELIRRCGAVGVEMDCGVIPYSGGDTACRYGSYFASLIGEGRAEVVEDAAEKRRGLAVLMRCQTGRDFEISDAMAASVAVIRVTLTQYTAKAKRPPEERDGNG